MQVGDAQLVEVVEVVHDARQRPREPVGVGHVADHRGPLEPIGLRLTLQIAEKQFVGAGRDVAQPARGAPCRVRRRGRGTAVRARQSPRASADASVPV